MKVRVSAKRWRTLTIEQPLIVGLVACVVSAALLGLSGASETLMTIGTLGLFAVVASTARYLNASTCEPPAEELPDEG